jgi:Uma2 family endonuclease
MSVKTARFTIYEYHKMIDAGVLADRRIELIDGELLEVSPEKPFHSGVNNRLFKYLYDKFRDIAEVRPGLPITLSNSEPEPDIVICRLEEHEYLDYHPTSDDVYVVIELSNSTLKFDLTNKKKIYADDEIAEYWVVDLNGRQINIFREPVNGEYQSEKIVKDGIESILEFPNISLELLKFFP